MRSEQESSEFLDLKMSQHDNSLDGFGAEKSIPEFIGSGEIFKDGHFAEGNIGDIGLSLKYEAYDNNDPEKGDAFNRMFYSESDNGQYYRLLDLVISQQNEEVECRELHLSDILPPGYSVFFCEKFVHPQTKQETSVNISDDKVIILDGHPLNIETLLMLFHEIGHAKFLTNDEEYKRIKSIWCFAPELTLKDSELERVLSEERTAWAYALETLRPFLRSMRKNVPGLVSIVKNLIYMKSLGTYNARVKSERAKRDVHELSRAGLHASAELLKIAFPDRV